MHLMMRATIRPPQGGRGLRRVYAPGFNEDRLEGVTFVVITHVDDRKACRHFADRGTDHRHRLIVIAPAIGALGCETSEGGAVKTLEHSACCLQALCHWTSPHLQPAWPPGDDVSHFESFPHFQDANVFNPLLHCFAGREVAIRRPGKEGATTEGGSEDVPRHHRRQTRLGRTLPGKQCHPRRVHDLCRGVSASDRGNPSWTPGWLGYPGQTASRGTISLLIHENQAMDTCLLGRITPV